MIDEKQQTLADRWLTNLKNKPAVAVAVVITAGAAGFGVYTDRIPSQAASQIQVNPQIQVSPSIQGSPQDRLSQTKSDITNAASLVLSPCIPIMATLDRLPDSDELKKRALSDPKVLALGLVDASQKGNLNCVRALLKSGAPPNGDEIITDQGTKNLTPLVAAAQASSLDVVRELLDAGANPNFQALRGYRPEATGTPPIVAAASQLAAAASQSSAIVKLLLEKGANVNAADDNGMTALHWAASSGEVELVKELVGRGAKTDVRDRLEQKTPLEKAKARDREGVIRFLQK